MKLQRILTTVAALFCIWCVHGAPSGPNILWIVAEDINPHLRCYGDTNAVTPHLDRFASSALRYRTCWSTAPVCAPARTALITGVYPNSSGGEHMRSEAVMPSFMKMYPTLLRERGYYCVNNAKEDYNLTKPTNVWHESSKKAHYRNRQPGQPFFAAFNIETTHESQIRARPHALQHDPMAMRLPAYHPDTPEARHDWAQYYDKITAMDAIAGRHLRELEEAGLAEDTIVFFYGDNGSGMPRSKRWPYNSGLHVPLIIRVPEKFRNLAPADYRPGGVSERLVSFVDFAPTLLSLAGVKPPDWMQGRAFMGTYAQEPTQVLHGLRGRMDERYDLVRSARNERFVYVRQFMPHRIYGQFIHYMFQTPTTRIWKQLYDEGKLAPPQTFFWETKPPEELYDLQADPDEVRNLAGSPAHQAVLEQMRAAVREQALRVRDLGFLPEAERHRRVGNGAPYGFGHDPERYPLERILAMAELASSLKPDPGSAFRAGLNDPEPGVRYWAALGLLMRGERAVTAAADALRRALKDESPSVRVAAAEALGRFGARRDLNDALNVLRELAHPERNSVPVCLEALSAIDALGPKATPILADLRAMPRKPVKPPPRLAEYVPRALENLVGTNETQTPKAAPTRQAPRANNPRS